MPPSLELANSFVSRSTRDPQTSYDTFMPRR